MDPSAGSGAPPAQTELERILAPTLARGAQWSIRLLREGDVLAEHAPHALVPTASIAKLFLLTEVAAQIEQGMLDPGTLLHRQEISVPVHDSGLWQHLEQESLSIRDAALLVASVSDNLATNALLDAVGLPAVRARAESLAPGGSRQLDFVRDARTPAMPPTLSIGCAADWTAFLTAMMAGRLVSPAVSAQLRAWMSTSMDLSMVASALALDPLSQGADPGAGPVQLLNKTGTDEGVRADVGVISAGGRTAVYAVLCRWDAPPREILPMMRAIGDLLRESPTGD